MTISRALVLAAMLSVAGPGIVVHAAEPSPVTVTADPIERFRIASGESRFGRLEFMGGLSLRSSDADFGSLSAFRFLDPGGRFLAAADTGFWVFGTLARDEQGRPTGMIDATIQPIAGPDGRPITSKWDSDVEGLDVQEGVATASFERAHRITEYEIADGLVGPPRRNLDFVVPRGELRMNRGFETVARAPRNGPLEGARVAVSEMSIDREGNIFAAIIEGPLRGVFKIVRRDEYDVTDGVFLPGGDLLLLERRFSMLSGVAMRLRRILGDDLRPGALVDGEVLLDADMTYQIDNMEGMDVWMRADGATMISLVSDDNQSFLQRSLYLEFRLLDD